MCTVPGWGPPNCDMVGDLLSPFYMAVVWCDQFAPYTLKGGSIGARPGDARSACSDRSAPGQGHRSPGGGEAIPQVQRCEWGRFFLGGFGDRSHKASSLACRSVLWGSVLSGWGVVELGPLKEPFIGLQGAESGCVRAQFR